MTVSYRIPHILSKCFLCYALFWTILFSLWFLILHRRSLVGFTKFMGVILLVTGEVTVGVTLLWVSMCMKGICSFSRLFRLVSLLMIRWSFFTIIIVLLFWNSLYLSLYPMCTFVQIQQPSISHTWTLFLILFSLSKNFIVKVWSKEFLEGIFHFLCIQGRDRRLVSRLIGSGSMLTHKCLPI